MKNILLFFGILLLFTNCNKETSLIQVQSSIGMGKGQVVDRDVCATCLCKAPNGCTLPCTELANWEEYTEDYEEDMSPTIEEAVRWKYITNDCTTTDNKPGLSCTKVKKGDCREAFDCLECDNCDM